MPSTVPETPHRSQMTELDAGIQRIPVCQMDFKLHGLCIQRASPVVDQQPQDGTGEQVLDFQQQTADDLLCLGILDSDGFRYAVRRPA